MIEITDQYLASQGLSKKFPERFWSKVIKDGPLQPHVQHLGPCWPFIGKRDRNGYGKIYTDGTGIRELFAHRAAWILSVGIIPADLCVLHHCDYPPCCNFRHLWIGTREQNLEDMRAKGRGVVVLNIPLPGEDHPTAKLTNAQVLEIRERLKSGAKRKILASEFNVSYYTICSIAWGRNWKCLLGGKPVD